EFDRAVDAPAIRIGTKISRIGAAAQALDQKEPVFLPDVSEEMLKHPELAPFAAQSSGRSTYVFPLFTAQQQYGLLTVTKEQGTAGDVVQLVRTLPRHWLESYTVTANSLTCSTKRSKNRMYIRIFFGLKNGKGRN